MKNFTDEQLAGLSVSDNAAFDILVRRHREYLLKFIGHRYGFSRPQAEDAVSEAFLRAYLNIRSFDPNRKWKTWLYRIAINAANSLAMKSRAVNASFWSKSREFRPEEHIDRILVRIRIEKALAELPAEHASLLRAYYFEGLQIEELSLKLKKPALQIKNRLRRAEILLSRQPILRSETEV